MYLKSTLTFYFFSFCEMGELTLRKVHGRQTNVKFFEYQINANIHVPIQNHSVTHSHLQTSNDSSTFQNGLSYVQVD